CEVRRYGERFRALLADSGERLDVEVVAEDVVRVVLHLQVAEAPERLGREGVVQPLDAAIRLEAQVYAAEVIPQVLPLWVDLAPARAHRRHVEIRRAITVGRGVRIDVGNGAADRADLEEVGGATVDEPSRGGGELRRDVLDIPVVGCWLAATLVVAGVGRVGDDAGIGRDDDALVVQRRDLRDRLQSADDRVGVVRVHEQQRLRDHWLARTWTAHDDLARDIPGRRLDGRAPLFEE